MKAYACRHTTTSARVVERFPLSGSKFIGDPYEDTQEDYMPFPLDDNFSGRDGSSSSLQRKPVFGVPVLTNHDIGNTASIVSYNILDTCKNKVQCIHDPNQGHIELQNSVSEKSKETIKSRDFNSSSIQSKVGGSLELSDLDYVLVSGPPLDESSIGSASKIDNPLMKSENVVHSSVNQNTRSTASMPIVGTTISGLFRMGSLENQNPAPGTSQASMDYAGSFERPSTHDLTRIKSLQQCAATINELVDGKIKSGRQLEAFSIQLIILAIWKQALHICHTHAASAMKGSPNQYSAKWEYATWNRTSSDIQYSLDDSNVEGLEELSSKMWREFLTEFGRAVELAQAIEAGELTLLEN